MPVLGWGYCNNDFNTDSKYYKYKYIYYYTCTTTHTKRVFAHPFVRRDLLFHSDAPLGRATV